MRFLAHFLMFLLYLYFTVKRILDVEKPDVIHTHNLKGIGYLIFTVRRLRIRHVHTP